MAPENQEKTTESAAPAAPAIAGAAKPSATSKAAKKEAEQPVDMRRRIIWACIWGYLGVNFLMFLRFFFPRVLYEPSTVFAIGYPSDFSLGVDTKFQKDYRVWVVRNTDRLFVIYARCTHLGCTPDWKSSENKFKCPCHGSGYTIDGINFEGPAPFPMRRYEVSLADDGQIVVNQGRLFYWEKSEFDDPRAFIAV
jgi:cytochrome b6-f complex iron-sulfur subunit